MAPKIKTHNDIPKLNSPEFDKWLKEEHARLNGMTRGIEVTEETIKITAAGKKAIGK